MRRTCMTFLESWLKSSRRKPLIIRGARQVGKTWVVQHLAQSTGMKLVMFNFEKTPGYASLFKSNDPREIVRKIEERFSITIEPENTILFLDEIQAEPELIPKLRWFYEDMPELPVVAAGSLLEFVLGTYPMSMPVGRVSFMYLEPFSFVEFLMALKKDSLVKVITSYTWDQEIHEVIHEELMRLFKHYVYIGGMPEAIYTWVNENSLEAVTAEHQNLMGSYRRDFGKYGTRVTSATLNKVLDAIPHYLGKKIIYSKLDPLVPLDKSKEALHLLSQARVVHKVQSTAANGLPLEGEVNPKFVKAIMLDVGLSSAMLNLTLDRLEDVEELQAVNKDGIAEQVVGQLLRTLQPLYIEPSLYYWLSLKRGSDAEMDYVIQHKGNVVPVEVKAGSTGTLKSLHQFMKLKKLAVAIRICSGLPGITEVSVKDEEIGSINYELRSVPFYLISELPRLLG